MSSDSDTLPSPAPPDAPKRRGHPQAGPETRKQRVERLQAELRDAQAALKLTEERRAAIVGAAALRHARRNTEFARQLAARLRAEINSKAERATVAGLLLDDVAFPSASTE